MIRLKALLSFGNSIDPTCNSPAPPTKPLSIYMLTCVTGDYVDAVTWSSLELAIVMICACLPAIRNLLIRFYPGTFLTSMRSSSNTQTKPSSSRGWRSGSGNAAPNGHFVELHDGTVISSEAMGHGPLKNSGKNSSLSRIEVVDEVWVHSSPREQEPVSHL
jgi:hypothetical protein